MTSQLLIIGIAVGVMLFLLSMIGCILWEQTEKPLWEHIWTKKYHSGLAEQPMLETESIYRTVARQLGWLEIHKW